MDELLDEHMETVHSDLLLSSSSQSSNDNINELSPRDQLELIKDLMEEAEDSPLVTGSTWYLLSTTWLTTWSHYCKTQGEFPGPMESHDLVDEENLHMGEGMVGIREGVREKRDYHVIPSRAWDLLVSW